jgi:hypothetical protein
MDAGGMFLSPSIGECGYADEFWKLRFGESYWDDPANVRFSTTITDVAKSIDGQEARQRRNGATSAANVSPLKIDTRQE